MRYCIHKHFFLLKFGSVRVVTLSRLENAVKIMHQNLFRINAISLEPSICMHTQRMELAHSQAFYYQTCYPYSRCSKFLSPLVACQKGLYKQCTVFFYSDKHFVTANILF